MKLCPHCGSAIATSTWRCATCSWEAAHRNGVTVLIQSDGDVSDAFSSEQFDNLGTVDSRHFWFAARNELITWALRRFFPNARTLLEVGCGNGQVLRAIADAMPSLQLTGLEGSFAGLRVVMERVPRLDAVQADATALPYDAEFDVVGAFDVLEHIPQDSVAMKEIARSVRPGGGVLLTVPQHPMLWSSLDRYSGHQRRYTRRELTSIVADARLEVLFVTSFVSFLLPALFLSRKREHHETIDPLREFRIPAALNTFGRVVMAVERRLITAGASLPAGASLLLVARRA